MPQWRITPAEYFQRLDLDLEGFKQELHLPRLEDVVQIVPLRDIKKIKSLVPIDREMLLHLLRRVKTLDGRLPFTKASMRSISVDPRQLKIGQRYVYRDNYQKILERGADAFGELISHNDGLGNAAAYFVFGPNGDDSYSMACYIPPIAERHGENLVIMDGIHRNYVAKQANAHLNAVILENVELPFPCSAHEWGEISVIPLADKPKELSERYFDLQKGLFRDLKYLGIDG